MGVKNMLNLLRANLYRAKKDKVLYICLILIFLMVITDCLFGLVTHNFADMEAFASIYNGKTMFTRSFDPTTNMGILIPIFAYVIMNRDYTHGTIRNKIICGYKKTSLYLSYYITTLILGIGLVLTNMFLNLSLGSLFLGFGAELNGDELNNIIKVVLLGTLVFSVFLTISHFIMHLLKSFGYIGYFISLFFIIGLTALEFIFADSQIIDLIVDCNPIRQIRYIYTGFLDTNKVVTMILSSFAYITTLNIVGLCIFNKSDLK